MIVAIDPPEAHTLIGVLAVCGTIVSAVLARRSSLAATRSDASKHGVDAALAGQHNLIADLQTEITRLNGEVKDLRSDRMAINKSLDDCRAYEIELRARVHRLEHEHNLEEP